MKKISILVMSTLIVGQVFCPAISTFAAIHDGDTTWWSVEEMLEFYQEVEHEKATRCGDSSSCKMDFSLEMMEMGPKYRALQKFVLRQFWITAVNPSSETIKVLLFDEDMMSKSMGIEEKIYLEHLYLGWFEEWNAQIFNYHHEQFTNGSMAGLHTMYDGSSDKDGPDWIPALTEVELSVAGSDLRNNHSGIIDYAIFAKDNMFNAAGTFNYSNCLDTPDYIDGVECQLMIPSDGQATYLPPREQIAEVYTDVTNGEDTENLDSLGVSQNYSSQQNTEENELTKETITPIEDNYTIIGQATNQNPLDENRTPKAPNTGSLMGVTKKGNVSMPWWIVAIEILGGILILWWFLPTRITKGQKKQKSPKKSSKTLDKKSQVG